MKNKIKNIIFIISIVFVVTVTLLELINLVTYNDNIYLADTDENIERLNDYKNRINNLEDSSCKSSLEKFVERYEKTSYKGEVSLKEIYNGLDIDSYPKHYQDIRKNCNLTEEDVKEHELVYYILDSMITYEEFFNRVRFSYEIRIEDKLIREVVEPSLDTYRYSKIKRSELSFIGKVLDLLEEKGEKNEK